MKKIYIFLASSITEFSRERDQIELFIRNISDRFEDNYNIKIVPLRCENVDPAVGKSRKQDEYNEMIEESDMCFFIFFTKAGNYTVEEFKTAVVKYRETGKPKVYVYFKNLKNCETAEQSIFDFMELVDKEFQHYYGSFDDVDTIKLRILLNLKFQEMDFLRVEFDEDKCIVDGIPLKQSELDIGNVSEFVNNKLLLDLRNQLKEVEEIYFNLKPKYASGEISEKGRKNYVDVASKRQSLLEAIEEMQKNVFMLSMSLSKDVVHGEMTPRLKKAYQYFERGDLEAALIVLDKDEIISEYQMRKERRQREQKQDAKLFIRELKTRIDILLAETKRETRFEEVEELYDIIVSESMENIVETETIFSFASFLYEQNNNKKAFILAKKLEELYSENQISVDDNSTSRLYGLLAQICEWIPENHNLIESYYKKAIDCCDKRNSLYLATIQYNLASYYNSYHNEENTNKAMEYLLVVKELLRNINPSLLDNNDKALYSRLLSGIGEFLINSYIIYNPFEKEKIYSVAKVMIEESLKTLQELVVENDKYIYDLSVAYYNYSELNLVLNDQITALQARKTSCELLKQKYQENPKRYLIPYCKSLMCVVEIEGLDDYSAALLKDYALKSIQLLEGELSSDEVKQAYAQVLLSISSVVLPHLRNMDNNNKAAFSSEMLEYLERSLLIYKELYYMNSEKYEAYIYLIYATEAAIYEIIGDLDNYKKYYSLCEEIHNRRNH